MIYILSWVFCFVGGVEMNLKFLKKQSVVKIASKQEEIEYLSDIDYTAPVQIPSTSNIFCADLKTNGDIFIKGTSVSDALNGLEIEYKFLDNRYQDLLEAHETLANEFTALKAQFQLMINHFKWGTIKINILEGSGVQ